MGENEVCLLNFQKAPHWDGPQIIWKTKLNLKIILAAGEDALKM